MKIKVKYIIKIFISCFLLLNILILPVHSQNINFIKGKLEEIGIPKEYSKNIYEYIENLNINEGKIKKIISDSSEIINDIKGGKSLKEFSLSQLSQIYSSGISSRLLYTLPTLLLHSEQMISKYDSTTPAFSASFKMK